MIDKEEVDAMVYINSLIYISTLMFMALLDYHYTQVILYYARGFSKKKLREEKDKDKALAKRQRAEDRYRKHSVLVLDNAGGNGVSNAVIVPKKVKPPLKTINGVQLPDGLEVPTHWQNDLNRQLNEEAQDQSKREMRVNRKTKSIKKKKAARH